MLFGLDYRQTKVTDSTLQNTLAILKNKRIPLDPRAKSSDTLALLTNNTQVISSHRTVNPVRDYYI